jgi:hypothetical protein
LTGQARACLSWPTRAASQPISDDVVLQVAR